MTKKNKIIMLLALIGLSGSVFAQQTVEKKEYYDVWKTQIMEIWHETGDGKRHGTDKTFYKSGKIHYETIYDLGRDISWKEYDQAGNLILHTNKNTNGEFEGEQKEWELINGKPVLVKYAKVHNGNLLEYREGKSTPYDKHFINNTYKEYDSNGKLSFSIINGKINGKQFFSTNSYGDKIIETNNPDDYYIEVIDNRISEINCKNYSLKILPGNKYFYYKSKGSNVEEGYYKLTDDYTNNIDFDRASLSAQGLNYMDFNLKKYYFDNAPNYQYLNDKIFRDKLAVKDSVWLSFRNGAKEREEFFRDGKKITEKVYYSNGQIKKEEMYDAAGFAIDYTTYNENGEVEGDMISSKEMEKNNNMQKELQEQKNNLKIKFYNSIFITYPEERNGYREVLGWENFMQTAYLKLPNKNKQGSTLYYNVSCKKPGTFPSDKAICDDDIKNLWTVFKTIDENFAKEIMDIATKGGDDIAVKKEQIALYNLLVEKIQQFEVRTINKGCKKITTKEELTNYLNSIK